MLGKRLPAILATAIMLASIPAFAEQKSDPYRNPEAVVEIKRVRDLLFDGKYDETVVECRNAQKKFPDLLVWHFAAMLAPQARMLEMHNWDLSNAYVEEWNGLLKLSEEIKKKRAWTAYDYLCLGGGYGVMGLHAARGKDYRKAFQIGVKAIEYMNSTLKTDPDCLDAYLGFGIYHYYRGVLSTRLKWLPFFANDRKIGLEELDKARKGLFARPLADAAQIYLYKDEGKWAEGLALAEKMRKEYPNSLLIPQLIGYFQLRLGKLDLAIANFDHVMKSDPGNGTIHMMRGVCLFFQDKLDESERELNASLGMKMTNEYNAPAYHFLGEIDWKRGKTEEARAHWKKALELDPDYTEVIKALDRKPGEPPK